MIKEQIKNNKGFSLIETLFYMSIFVVLSIVVINSLIVMVKSFSETSAQADFVQSANILERMSREIRQATSVASLASPYNDLTLNSTDSSGVAKTVEFKLLSNNLQLKENGTLTGNLNAPNIHVTSLTFTQITTAKGKAIRIQMSVQDTKDRSSRTVSFYDTIELRKSYAS